MRSEEWGVRSEEWGVRSEEWEVRSGDWGALLLTTKSSPVQCTYTSLLAI